MDTGTADPPTTRHRDMKGRHRTIFTLYVCRTSGKLQTNETFHLNHKFANKKRK